MFDGNDIDRPLDLDGVDAFLAEQEDEAAAVRAAYIGAAVTQIASLRAELSGRQWG
jgi:hypothetical protein